MVPAGISTGLADARTGAYARDPWILEHAEAVVRLMDASGEPQHIRDLYGCTPGDGSFASNCLLARRMVEYSDHQRAFTHFAGSFDTD